MSTPTCNNVKHVLWSLVFACDFQALPLFVCNYTNNLGSLHGDKPMGNKINAHHYT